MSSSHRDNEVRKHLASVRETVESIWIAIVLAFVLRSFVLEAFVIPTGSMAPRLLGQHWQFDCPACGYPYAYGIHTEPGKRLRRAEGKVKQPDGSPAVCPNCQHQYPFRWDFDSGGDRVLVLKYLYRFREPRAWDVVVFKNPQDNEQNYIKRLIGLPGRMIEIIHGDVFYCVGQDFNDDRVIDWQDFDHNGDGRLDEADFTHERHKGECPWKILRKPPKTQEVMWQVIFDNDYLPDEEIYRSRGWREWTHPWQVRGETKAWNLTARNGRGNGRVFAFSGSPEPAELRFLADRSRFFPIYAYNQTGPGRTVLYDEEKDVNSDLKLSFLFVPGSPEAKVGLHLSSFEHHFRAWVSADGICTLEHGVADAAGKIRWVKGASDPWASDRRVPLKVGRGYEVALTHVDRRVTVWVNGKPVVRTTDAQYRKAMLETHEAAPPEPPAATTVQSGSDRQQLKEAEKNGVPTPTVAIYGVGGPAKLWHVRLMRDVYYTCPNVTDALGQPTDQNGHGTKGNPMVLRRFLDQPDLDEFYVLGDNSPSSRDSRMWGYHAPSMRGRYRDGTVPRYNMMGKAFFVYWPGGYRLPLVEKLPIVPNVGRMRLIR